MQRGHCSQKFPAGCSPPTTSWFTELGSSFILSHTGRATWMQTAMGCCLNSSHGCSTFVFMMVGDPRPIWCGKQQRLIIMIILSSPQPRQGPNFMWGKGRTSLQLPDGDWRHLLLLTFIVYSMIFVTSSSWIYQDKATPKQEHLVNENDLLCPWIVYIFTGEVTNYSHLCCSMICPRYYLVWISWGMNYSPVHEYMSSFFDRKWLGH